MSIKKASTLNDKFKRLLCYCSRWLMLGTQAKELRSKVFLRACRDGISFPITFKSRKKPPQYLSALSPTPRQPRRLSFRRKPPHLLEMFSTTRPCWRHKAAQ